MFTRNVNDSFALYAKQEKRIGKLFQQPDIITTTIDQQPDFITSTIDDVSSKAQPLVRQIRKLPEKVKKLIELLPHQEVCCSLLTLYFIIYISSLSNHIFILQINEEEASLFDVLWLLLGSVIFVPIFQKLPGTW